MYNTVTFINHSTFFIQCGHFYNLKVTGRTTFIVFIPKYLNALLAKYNQNLLILNFYSILETSDVFTTFETSVHWN